MGSAFPGPHNGGWEGSLRGGRGDHVPPTLPSTPFRNSLIIFPPAGRVKKSGLLKVLEELQVEEPVTGHDVGGVEVIGASGKVGDPAPGLGDQ